MKIFFIRTHPHKSNQSILNCKVFAQNGDRRIEFSSHRYSMVSWSDAWEVRALLLRLSCQGIAQKSPYKNLISLSGKILKPENMLALGFSHSNHWLRQHKPLLRILDRAQVFHCKKKLFLWLSPIVVLLLCHTKHFSRIAGKTQQKSLAISLSIFVYNFHWYIAVQRLLILSLMFVQPYGHAIYSQ